MLLNEKKKIHTQCYVPHDNYLININSNKKDRREYTYTLIIVCIEE